MFHCIMKVQDRRNKLLHIGVVVELEKDYLLEEMVDALTDLSNVEDDKSLTICTCTVEISGDEELVPLTTILVPKTGKEQLQQVIFKIEQLYNCSRQGFIKNYKILDDSFPN